MAGTNFVLNKKDYLNKINVFPVPDGDTGTNMASTLKTISDTITDYQYPSIHKMSSAIADSALMGARGNSGVILAQFFQGLQEGLTGLHKAYPLDFSKAVHNAANAAWSAISNPVEGTILSVIRDWAESLRRNVGATEDFSVLFDETFQDAQEALDATPKQMKALADAGVVDAGAHGFITMLEGIKFFIESGSIKDLSRPESTIDVDIVVDLEDHDIDKLTYQFCTEALLEGEDMSRETIRTDLEHFGDSLIVAGSPSRIKIHIHADDPELVFEKLGDYGEIVSHKIDDMKQQYLHTHTEAGQECVIVVDSCCDLPRSFMRENGIQVVPLNVHFGDRTFVDRLTLSPGKFFQLLDESPDHPSTSQPSPKKFEELYSRQVQIYPSVLSVHISAKLSGTFQNAVNMASSIDGGRIKVIDSRNVSIGTGLIVKDILPMVRDNEPIEKIISRIEKLIDRLKIYIVVPSLHYLVKGGRVGKARGAVGNSLRIKPILSIRNGEIVAVDKAFGMKKAIRKVIELFRKDLAGFQKLRFGIAHANDAARADEVKSDLVREFKISDDILITEISTVVATHAGPGCVAIAALYD